MNEGKICTKCNEFKLLSEYYKANNKSMGVKCACKDCERPVKRNHYKNNKGKYKEAYQEFLIINPDYQHNYQLERKYKKIRANRNWFLIKWRRKITKTMLQK